MAANKKRICQTCDTDLYNAPLTKKLCDECLNYCMGIAEDFRVGKHEEIIPPREGELSGKYISYKYMAKLRKT